MPWKGNIRELENKIERATLICRNDLVEKDDFVTGGRRRAGDTGGQADVPSGSLKELEQKAIYQTLDRTDGNRTHAAQILGISVRTLRNKLSEYRKKMEVK